jgi:DNA polymerase III sliding clamp (beta) subunit (PCNA family)
VNFELEGIEGDINFSAEFLADFLNVVGDKKVILDTKKYNLPGLMTIDNPESNFKYVIMPIK